MNMGQRIEMHHGNSNPHDGVKMMQCGCFPPDNKSRLVVGFVLWKVKVKVYLQENSFVLKLQFS